jgi:hypothetical protein
MSEVRISVLFLLFILRKIVAREVCYTTVGRYTDQIIAAVFEVGHF